MIKIILRKLDSTEGSRLEIEIRDSKANSINTLSFEAHLIIMELRRRGFDGSWTKA